MSMSEADHIRNNYFDNPFVSNAEYGRMVEIATIADDYLAMLAEQAEQEEIAGEINAIALVW